MRTRVQKWGNSLGLRIPHTLAAGASVRAGSSVDLQFHNGRIVVEPISPPSYELKELLAGVTKANLHSEIATGKPVGHEGW